VTVACRCHQRYGANFCQSKYRFNSGKNRSFKVVDKKASWRNGELTKWQGTVQTLLLKHKFCNCNYKFSYLFNATSHFVIRPELTPAKIQIWNRIGLRNRSSLVARVNWPLLGKKLSAIRKGTNGAVPFGMTQIMNCNNRHRPFLSAGQGWPIPGNSLDWEWANLKVGWNQAFIAQWKSISHKTFLASIYLLLL
jgi:hypothetical protein